MSYSCAYLVQVPGDLCSESDFLLHKAFLGLQSGTVVTYDLLCLRVSPYSIQSPWKQYEDKMIASGERNTRNFNAYVTCFSCLPFSC